METKINSRSWRDALKLYDTETGAVRWERGGTFEQVAFSPDGSLLVAGGLAKAVVLDVPTGHEIHELAYGGNLHISGIAFSPDGATLATGADDRRIKLWNTANWWPLDMGGRGHDAPAQSVAFSPDGRLIASGGRDNTVRLWSWPAGAEVRVFEGVGTNWGVAKLRFSDDGMRLAALATSPESFTVWEVATGTQLASFGGNTLYAGMAFLPDHDRLLTSLNNGPAAVWDVTTGAQVSLMGKNNGAITDVALLPGGSQVVWKGRDSGVGLCDLTTGGVVRYFPQRNTSRPEEPLLVAPDGSWLMVHDQAWTTAAGEVIAQNISVADDSDGGAAMAPDSRLVYKARSDGIHAWERLTMEDIHTFGPKAMHAAGLALSPDGRVLAAACTDGSIVMLDVSGGLASGVPAEPRTEADLESLWRLLGGTDHWAANIAMWNLARAGRPAVDFLARKLTAAQPLSAVQLAELRGKLSDPDGVARQTAALMLLDHGIVLSPAELETLRQAQAAALQAADHPFGVVSGIGPDLALVRGLIHDRFGQPAEPAALTPLPDRLRSSRAVGALEHSTAPAAAQVLLKALAAGYPKDPQTVEAVSALQFLKTRP